MLTPVYLNQYQLQCALGNCLDSAVQRYSRGELPQPVLNNDSYSYQLTDSQALYQRLQQLLSATLQQAKLDAADCALLVASTALDVSVLEQRLQQGEMLSMAMLPSFDSFSNRLAQDFEFAAIRIINTACTSAANALLYAQRMLHAGLYRHVLVLAFEPPGSITRTGFSALELSSRSGQYRPFHPQRDGLILGETYATALLSQQRAPTALASLQGGYSACDTYNITTTAEDGSHIAAVMQQALQQAEIAAADVALLKLHGTATAANDIAERNGIQRVFDGHYPPLAVLKPYLGHTLGACGLSELLLLLAAARDSVLPPLAYAADAELPFATTAQQLDAGALVMANFFGFGGNNASLILRTC